MLPPNETPRSLAWLACSAIALSLLSIVCSCSNRSSGNSPGPKAGEECPAFDPETTEISLERPWCWWNCPAYTITIRGDGSVTYEGTSSVKVIGVRHATISSEDVRNLFARMMRANFLELKDEYVMEIYDIQSTVLTLSVGNRRKRIVHAWTDLRAEPGPAHRDEDWAMHDKLAELELAVDKAADSEQWVGAGAR